MTSPIGQSFSQLKIDSEAWLPSPMPSPSPEASPITTPQEARSNNTIKATISTGTGLLIIPLTELSVQHTVSTSHTIPKKGVLHVDFRSLRQTEQKAGFAASAIFSKTLGPEKI